MDSQNPNRQSAVIDHKFAGLDGLRGIAALAVALYHWPDIESWIKPHNAYLAVDLFFCISGFVIAHAYGRKFASGLSTRSFMVTRLIRLYPLYLLSIALSGAVYLASALFGSSNISYFLNVMIPAVLFIPNITQNVLYPINGPAWSLFFELIINLVFARFWSDIKDNTLIITCVLSAAALSFLGYRYGTVDGGYEWFGFGLALGRVAFGFSLGVLIYRKIHLLSNFRVPMPLVAVALTFLLYAPNNNRIVFDLIFVFLAMPILIVSSINPTNLKFFPFKFAGSVSYSLYVLHVPVFMIYSIVLKKIDLNGDAVFFQSLLFIALIAMCYLADRFYDIPVRRLLMRVLR